MSNIHLIKNPVNLGFAGGEISALTSCNGEYILLLNNDATIKSDAIEKCLQTFETDTKIAVVGGRSYSVEEDGTASHRFYSYQRVDPITADVMTYGKDLGVVTDTPTVSGSGVMIKKSVIDTYGYFDERFFAYYEETDLFARYRAGLRVVYNPDFVIWHKDGASTKNHRFMYYYLMLKNQFLFAYKNYEKSYLKDFKKTYYRNFRRSLWLYLKSRSETEAIHIARVRSAVWNLVNFPMTAVSRYNTQNINPNFDYSHFLLTEQRIPTTLIIDATKSTFKETHNAINKVLDGTTVPSEVVVVSNKTINNLPSGGMTSVRNIVDKKIFSLSVYDFGFMSSNTDIITISSVENILKSQSSLMNNTLNQIYRSIITHESSICIAKESRISGSNLRLLSQSKLDIVAIRKTDLVTFLDITPSVDTITPKNIGQFVSWCISEGKPISRINTSDLALSIVTDPSSAFSPYPILNNVPKWHLKNIFKKLHLSRVINKLIKPLMKTSLQKPQAVKLRKSSSTSGERDVGSFPVIINIT